ncbi:hypothetical protein BD311DRAFT_457575 [Dichomitus squalens]|uniref:Uncharacterized protein n=1 Tax=Dichomitus squalens TaxID=114155 RepID=A0A4Q9MJ35_9APHY|nr:hypothetical protein BD311DRAFT_457575 [Dichomitus squalens]
MIDPILLNLAASAMTDTSSQLRAPASAEAHAYPGLVADLSGSASSVTSTAIGQPLAHTPSLVASPSVTTTSLADSGDAGPATPSWDWAFPELGHVESTKMLDELTGMDVDVPMPEWRDDTAAGTVLPRTKATGVSLAPPVVTGAAAEQTPTSSGPTPSCAASASVDTPPPPHPALYSHPSTLPSEQMAQLVPSPSVAPLLPKPSARAKGKAKAVPGPGCDVGVGIASAGAGKLGRRAVVERARAMRAALVKEVERAKVALWETTLEQGVLVGLGRELEKEGGGR